MARTNWLHLGLAAITIVTGAAAGRAISRRWQSPGPARAKRSRERRRVVILGAGFGGLNAARRLDDLIPDDPTIEIVVLDRKNYHLFTPLLTLVANGLIQPPNVAFPIRRVQRNRSFRFRETEVRGIDLTRRLVNTADGNQSYDVLLLALGAQTNYFGNAEIQRYAHNFKSLEDAIRLRNHIIDVFEEAAQETDPERRQRLLTFVIGGAGPTGVELAASLHDFIHHSLVDLYPTVSFEDVSIIVLEAADRILPNLDRKLADAAVRTLRKKRIEIRLNTAIKGAGDSHVETAQGEQIRTNTFVWVAGVKAPDLVANLPVQKGRGGAVAVNDALELLEQPGVFAIGDCAYFVNPRDGKPLPPDAKVAIQQGSAAGDSIDAYLRGKRLPAFHYRRFGDMLSLGEHTAVADVMGLKLVGFPAWLVWRVYYIGRLMGVENRLRVAGDFALGMLSERDTSRVRIG